MTIQPATESAEAVLLARHGCDFQHPEAVCAHHPSSTTEPAGRCERIPNWGCLGPAAGVQEEETIRVSGRHRRRGTQPLRCQFLAAHPTLSLRKWMLTPSLGSIITADYLLPRPTPVNLHLLAMFDEVQGRKEQGRHTTHLYLDPKPETRDHPLQRCHRSVR